MHLGAVSQTGRCGVRSSCTAQGRGAPTQLPGAAPCAPSPSPPLRQLIRALSSDPLNAAFLNGSSTIRGASGGAAGSAARCRAASGTGSGATAATAAATAIAATAQLRAPHAAPSRARGRGHQAGGGGAAAAAAAAGGGAATGPPPPPPPAPGPRVSEPSTALLLAWFACGNRSLFAAQVLVEAVTELYREGRSFEELQLSIKMAAHGGGGGGRGGLEAAGGTAAEVSEGPEVAAAQAPLLQGQDEDVLVSWVALVFLTLEELGVPRDRAAPEDAWGAGAGAGAGAPPTLPPPGPVVVQAGGGGSGLGPGAGAGVGSVGGGGGMASRSAYLRGMLGYVRQTLGMYEEGQSLAAVAGLQGLVQQSSGAASSPFLLLMQQYTRLVLLTVEVVAAAGLPTSRYPLRPPSAVTQPSGYTDAFAPACAGDAASGGGGAAGAGDAAASGGGGGGGVCSPRGLAVRLLMAFMGAVLGSGWSLGKFVEGVRVAYTQGVAADELFSELDEQEFLQSGGLLPIASVPPSEPDSSTFSAPAPAAAAAADAAAAGGDAAAPAAPPAAPEADPPPPQHATITKKLLSSWISLSYMTLAQLAVPYPEAGRRLGWAWAGFGDPTEALGMNDFVGNVLRQMAGADPRAIPEPQAQTQTQAEGEQPPQPPQPAQPAPQPLAAQESQTQTQTQTPSAAQAQSQPVQPGQPGPHAGGAAGEGAEGAEAEAAAGAEAGAGPEAVVGSPGEGGQQAARRGPGRRRGGEAAPLVRLEDDSLASTSTAFRVLSQQVALVQAVCRHVMGL